MQLRFSSGFGQGREHVLGGGKGWAGPSGSTRGKPSVRVYGVSVREYRHKDLGLVVDLGGSDAAAVPLGVRLRGRAAKLVTRGYHLYALPTMSRRSRVAADWSLAVVTAPDTVTFGLVSRHLALITQAEYHQQPHS